MSRVLTWLGSLPALVVRVAATMGVISALFALAAAIDPQWIEGLIGLSPDGGSGEAEWGLVGVFGVIAVTLLGGAALAHRAREAAESAA